jgi:hypothetical protein
MNTRTCNTCSETKPLDEFYIRKSRGKEYYQLRCKSCTKQLHHTPKRYRQINEWKKRNPEKAKEYLRRSRIKRMKNGKLRETRLKATYNIDESQYQDILKNQDNRCYFCGIEAEEYMEAKGRHLAVDHDHQTNVIRGILCYKCNVRMSFVDEFGLPRIAEYLNTPTAHFANGETRTR